MSKPTTPSTPQKTVLEVTNETHQRLRDGANSTGNSLKRFTSLLLDYALGKFEAGEIVLREPTIEERQPETAATR
jgi:hypothetical protein